MEAWDRWHFFAGTGANGANPRRGDEVDIECRDQFTTYADAPPHIVTGRWNPLPPHGIPSHLEILRWRHRDQTTARSWQQWWDEGEADAKVRGKV